MNVNTVTGAITAKDLGVVMPHEHIFLDLTGFFEKHPVPGCTDPASDPVTMERLGVLRRDPYALCDNLLLEDFDVQKSELMYFKNAGGRTVADATMDGIGRNPEALVSMSRQTGLNIIMGTGYYVGATHPEKLDAMTEGEIAEVMVGEITEGVGKTRVKAGFIGEIGISEIFPEKERKVLRAAALAQLATGVSVMVHINPWKQHGIEAVRILLDAGVAPGRIAICHVDVENRDQYIKELLSLGVFVEFDNFGKEYYIDQIVRRDGYDCFVTDRERVSYLAGLINDGYVSQILVSCDVCLKNLLRRYGGWGYDHILTNVVPMMHEAGIMETDIHSLLITNTAAFFCGKEYR